MSTVTLLNATDSCFSVETPSRCSLSFTIAAITAVIPIIHKLKVPVRADSALNAFLMPPSALTILPMPAVSGPIAASTAAMVNRVCCCAGVRLFIISANLLIAFAPRSMSGATDSPSFIPSLFSLFRAIVICSVRDDVRVSNAASSAPALEAIEASAVL